MAGIALEDCVKQFSISVELLDTTVSDEHIRAVSKFWEWRTVAPHLLEAREIEEVDVDQKHEQEKRHKSLQKWKSKFAFKATYKKLINAFLESARADHAEEVCKLLASLAPQKGLLESEDTQTQQTTEMRQLQRQIQTLRDQNLTKDEKLNAMQSEIQQLQIKLDAAVAWSQQQLLERDAEINRLQRELKDQTASKYESVTALPSPQQPHAHPSSGLQLPLTLRWKPCREVPCRKSFSHSVVVEDKLYFGGGVTGKGGVVDDERTVYEYHPQEDEWFKLDKYEYWYFAMAALNNKLTLVGGRGSYTKLFQATSEISVWEKKKKETSYQWTHPYPDMPSRRWSPAVATYNKWLVVAGGNDGRHELATVELLNIVTLQWSSMASLPVNCSHMTAAVVEHELFLVGGTLNTTLVVSLPDILDSDESCTTTKTSAQWRTLHAPTLERSAAIAFHGSLLAVGGDHGDDYSTAIHIYQPDTKMWSKFADLPTARSSCSCALLSSGEIIVAGGLDSNGKRSSRIDAAALPHF